MCWFKGELTWGLFVLPKPKKILDFIFQNGSPTVHPENYSPDLQPNACMCKGYSHFREEHVVWVVWGGKSLEVSLQLLQLPLHLPEAFFQILCRHWNTFTYIKTETIPTFLQVHKEILILGNKKKQNRHKKSTKLQVKSSVIIWKLWRSKEKLKKVYK